MILSYNKNLIKKTLGVQGKSQCGVYAVAYGFTILEKKCRVSGSPASHQAVANKYNGGHFAMCYWGTMGVSNHSAGSTKSRYKAIISELKRGKPVVVATKGSYANHYVCVIGVKDGKNENNVKESDFYIIDPADNKIGYFGSTWAHGFNSSSYGLQYITFPGKGVGSGGDVGGGGEAEHPKSWYIKKYGTGAEVYFELSGYGYTHKACCAVLGNMQQESGIRVYTGGSYDGNGSEGLCQWTFGRKTKMQDYAKKHSKSKTWKSVDGQVAYLVYELKNSEKAANKVLKNDSLSLKEMTEEFERKFERAGVPNFPARVKYAKEWDNKMKGSGGGEGGEDGEVAQVAVNMQQRSSQLYSSDNYKYITAEEQQETEEQKRLKELQQSNRDFLKNINVDDFSRYSLTGAMPDGGMSITASRTSGRLIKNTNSVLPISEAMVEAPFVEVDFNGTKIGTYKNSVDDFPNHISSLEVDKINGEINKYTFNLVHQIRPGEDPNLIDKIISKVRYDKIGIKYGDFNSNVIYGDEKAIITNVSMNRDYVSNRISYTIYATSANELVTSHKINFSAVKDKPSNVINNLLYENNETSDLLLSAFPGMKNKTLVASKNLIPSNDAILNIDEQLNVNSIEYINYLVSCMSNSTNAAQDIIRKSTYYISYENDFKNTMGGSFFKIVESTPQVLNKFNTNSIFEVTVGYPDNNYVMGFSVDNDIAWSLLYENASIADEYVYFIDDNGNSGSRYSPNLISSSSILNETQKNWWTQMTHFPLNASLTLKGMMKPVMLMDYIIVNVVFYGQKHITSGVYTITGQKDTLSGEGFRTTLALTRVGAN